METTMYNTLLQLPLFQGLGQNDITNIIEKVKIHFSKPKCGDQIISQGETCNKLVFLLNGDLDVITEHKKNTFTWHEVISAPFLIEPYSLFGMYPSYDSSYTALTDAHLLSIDKNFLLSELSKYEIFRLNFLNILSNRIQTLQNKIWNSRANGTEDKIIEFFFMHSEKPEGRKMLRIKMEDFAMLLDDTRLNVSRALNELQEAGLVVLRRKEIEIPNLSQLIDYKNLG